MLYTYGEFDSEVTYTANSIKLHLITVSDYKIPPASS